MIKKMELQRYRDEFAEFEVGDQLGKYLVSYATDGHLVEIHLFKSDEGLVVYVTKSPGVPMAEAQQVARQVVTQFQASQEGRDVTGNPKTVYDGYSMGRSGSL